ncbi:hypothetical protein ABHF33_11460 [Chitinibacter sp. FCG-7]|uniref:ABC-type transport auxiliary lipoprotein component domain-containing protein n=1 Tax=Chitinibacter mangrovi TaxID=3153927 RepID=A0AAU7F7Q0_9NEIS
MKKLIALLVLAVCTACSTTPVARQDFLISAERDGASRAARFGVLQVNELRSNPPYRDLALIYKESPQRFVADPYNGFLAPPGNQITRQTRAWLARSGLFSRVNPMGSSLIAPWQLEGELLAMHIDVSTPAQPKAVIQVQYLLSHQQQSAQFTLSAEHAIADASPNSAAAGFSAALESLFKQLEQELASSNLN